MDLYVDVLIRVQGSTKCRDEDMDLDMDFVQGCTYVARGQGRPERCSYFAGGQGFVHGRTYFAGGQEVRSDVGRGDSRTR